VPAAAPRYCAHPRRLRPDIVHTHGFRSDVVDGSVARSEGAAVVSTCHGFIDTDLRGANLPMASEADRQAV